MTLTQINRAGLDADALDRVFTIGASGSSAYTFQGEGLNGTVNNPTLYLTRGKTYRFENGSGGHPIRIQSTSGASGTAYNTGVTNNAGSGTVIVEVQHDAPDVLYYQCTSHAAMNGILYITGALADGGVTTAKIADDAVTTDKIADAAVTVNRIANNAVTEVKLGTGAVTAVKIGSGQVINAKIADDAITTTKIANNVVTTAKIPDEAVTLAKLPHGTSSNDGKFLRANNGADPTFESIPAGITINNQADNRLITATGTTDTLKGEVNATFTGTKLNLGPYDGGTDVNLSLRNTNSSGYGAYISGGSGTNYVLRLDDYQQNAMFRFNANGKLGIGTGAPIGQLHLYQTSNDPYMYIQRGSGDTAATIGGIFWRNSTNSLALIDAQSADLDSGRMRFYVSKDGTMTESLKIDENGNLEVLDASEARLQVKTPSNGIIALRADGVNTQLGTWSDHDLKIVRNSTIKASITSNGLCFNSDTAAANALDDYEEGTWTPTLHGTWYNSGVFNNAVYTKIGRIVHVSFDLYRSANNMGWQNGASIRGFPFGVYSSGYITTAVLTTFSYSSSSARFVENYFDSYSGGNLYLHTNNQSSNIRHLWCNLTYTTT